VSGKAALQNFDLQEHLPGSAPSTKLMERQDIRSPIQAIMNPASKSAGRADQLFRKNPGPAFPWNRKRRFDRDVSHGLNRTTASGTSKNPHSTGGRPHSNHQGTWSLAARSEGKRPTIPKRQGQTEQRSLIGLLPEICSEAQMGENLERLGPAGPEHLSETGQSYGCRGLAIRDA